MNASTELATRLDQATLESPLLEHPFYRAWADGTLSRGDLAHYSTQYWRQVESFPSYLSAIRDRLPEGAARDAISDNLRDEVDGDHAGLWLAFAEAMGVKSNDVKDSPVEPETAECVAAFTEGTRERSPAFALGMVYGYESQTPAVAETKVRGLRDNYGVDGAGLDYFELHGELDVEHTRELGAAIASVATSAEEIAEAEAGARAGSQAIWHLLDGVTRARGIC